MNKSHTVRVGNTTYANGATLARVMGIAKSTAYHRLKSDNFPDWQYIGADEHIPVVETSTNEPWDDIRPVEEDEKREWQDANQIRITWLNSDGQLRTSVQACFINMHDRSIDRFARLGEELPTLCPVGVETCQFQIQGYSGEYNHTLKRIIIQSKECSALIHIGSDLHITHYSDQNEPMYSDEYIEYLNTQTGYTTYYLINEPPVNSKDVLYAHRDEWIPVWLNQSMRDAIPDEDVRMLILSDPHLIKAQQAFGKRYPRIELINAVALINRVMIAIQLLPKSQPLSQQVLSMRAQFTRIFNEIEL